MLRLHDSLTKETREFRPLQPGVVRMYNCGPTVYSYAHIGNFRAYLFVDLLRRWLELGHQMDVRQVMNITDVGHMLADADVGEDKMEVAAREAGTTPEEIAAFYTKAFLEDMRKFGVREPLARPRASAYVPQMVALIQELLANGHAYRVGDDVYYDVSSFPAYGKLSGNKIEALDPGSRIEVRKEKKHPADFALWISNPHHLMQWDGPLGGGHRGYPGWHIECSAMARELLGDQLDIHTGGEDNKFPHHECEIAQTEGVTGKPFSQFWLHAAHLLVDGEKMSKSKGNFYRLDDLLAKGYSAEEVRWYLLSTHYRQQMNFTLAGLDAAKAGLARLADFAGRLRDATAAAGAATGETAAAMLAMEESLDDDLNVSAALAAVFEWVTALNARMASGPLPSAEKEAALALALALEAVFGVALSQEQTVPAEVTALVEQRAAARAAKDFAASDRLRDEIAALGWEVKDTAQGQRLQIM
jgi:cysteinyl-tRNA synthetase